VKKLSTPEFSPAIFDKNSNIESWQITAKAEKHGVAGIVRWANGEKSLFKNGEILKHESFDFTGLMDFTPDGRVVTYIYSADEYFIVVGNKKWKESFYEVSLPVVGMDGISIKARRIKADKYFQVITNEIPWCNKFNKCSIPLNDFRDQVIVSVGIGNYQTIAVNDRVWQSRYNKVSQVASNFNRDVFARVKRRGETRIALNDKTSLDVFGNIDLMKYRDGEFLIAENNPTIFKIYKIVDENDGHFKLEQIESNLIM